MEINLEKYCKMPNIKYKHSAYILKETSNFQIFILISAVRVKGGKSLRNGMWNGVWNGIIMRNTIYAGNKLTEERILFSRQFYKSSSFFDVADYSRFSLSRH